MKKKTLTLLFAALLPLATSAQNATPTTQKLNIATYAISNLYVDKVDENKLTEDAIRGMLEKLDPHSTYLDPKEVKEMNEPLQGNFDGIGIQFNMNNDTLYVIQTIGGGPSERVGIMPGDRMIKVNDTIIAGVKMANSDIMKRLRGKRGTNVNVVILRRGVKEPIEFKITRDKIPIYSVDAAFMANKNTGYIRISRFAATTHEEFVKSLYELQAKGMTNLIIDLQGNGGGYLNTAIDIANELLDTDQLIVYTQGLRSPKSEAKATRKGLFRTGKVIVLVDETSASASEIVSGAVQDWDRGILVGRRTFGKGLVQRPIPLPDGSMMRLTVSRYYTPAGRCIQKSYEEGNDAYEKDILSRYKHGELIHADSIQFPDSLKYNTLKNKRIVYGGGGIMPDIFVPLDTTKYTDFHRNVVAKGVINRITITFVDQQRKELMAKYPDADTFVARFSLPQSAMDDLLKECDKEKIEIVDTEYQKSKPIIEEQLKALIARDLYDIAAYYKVMNAYNDSYKKALEILSSTKQYESLLKGEKTK